MNLLVVDDDCVDVDGASSCRRCIGVDGGGCGLMIPVMIWPMVETTTRTTQQTTTFASRQSLLLA